VLQAAREEAGTGDLDRRAGAVDAADGGNRRALQLVVRAGHGQAALVVLLRLAAGLDRRVDDMPDVALARRVDAVIDEHGQVEADLGCGQPDAFGERH